MGKLKQLKEEFFTDNISYDTNKDSEYGIIPFEMDKSYSDMVLKEALDFGEEIKHKSTKDPKLSELRKVEAWSLDPKDSFTSEILQHALIDINRVFNYKLSKIEGISYLEYGEGCKYDWHTDVGSGLQSLRKISISWTLNSGYIGGNLQFFADGGEVITMNPTPERLIAFTSFLPHRVTPVKRYKKVHCCMGYRRILEMTTLNQQIIYDKVKENFTKEIEDILDRINDLMEKDLDDEDINKLTHYFIVLSNLNQAKVLVSSIRPTKKEK